MSRIGLQIPSFTVDVPDDAMFERVVELATAAEETGFDSVWFPVPSGPAAHSS